MSLIVLVLNVTCKVGKMEEVGQNCFGKAGWEIVLKSYSIHLKMFTGETPQSISISLYNLRTIILVFRLLIKFHYQIGTTNSASVIFLLTSTEQRRSLKPQAWLLE